MKKYVLVKTQLELTKYLKMSASIDRQTDIETDPKTDADRQTDRHVRIPKDQDFIYEKICTQL